MAFAGDGIDHGPVAEQLPPSERADDVGHHAHGRQNHDVNGRVGVEPKEMLPQERLAATRTGAPVAERQSAGRQKKGRINRLV